MCGALASEVMDNLTHSLVGAVMGQAGLKRTTGLAMPALIIGANLPDVDAACFFWLEGTEHLAFRRGITHGPPALVLLPLVLAGLLWAFDRWQSKRGTRPEGRLPVRFGWLYAMAFVGCLSHPFFDWLNVYGIRLLEPFSSQWFYGDTLFIIDPWLWAMLIGSVWWSRRREKAETVKWARPAQVGIAAVLAYIGVNWAITQHVVRETQESLGLSEGVIANPRPIIFFDREVLIRDNGVWWLTLESSTSQLREFPNKLSVLPCRIPDLSRERIKNSELDAFLIWWRAPMPERAEDGSVILYDARFYDPRARDRFSVALPDVRCEPLP